METKHTPTPWRTGGNFKSISVGLGDVITEITTVHGIQDIPGSRKANAEFIVRACNLHDELVLALELILKSHDASCKGEECQLSGIDLGRIALNKAKGN